VLLGLVFVVALALRLANWWGQWQHNPFFESPIMDEQRHHEWAQLIASGVGMGPRPFFRAPLYYYLLGGLYAVFGVNIALARLLGCLLGAATCYLVARLGVALGGLGVGLLAGLLMAFYWPLIYFDNLLLTVGLEVFLDVLLLLLLLRVATGDLASRGGEGGSLRWLLAAGVVWGLSAITRPNVLAFAPGVALWLWLGMPRGVPAWRKLLGLLVLAVGAAAAILPVTIRNRVVGGEWVLIATNGGVNFYIGNNPRSDGIAAIVPGTRPDWQGGYEDTHRIPELELGRKLSEGEVSRYWRDRAVAWIRAEPLAWLKLTLHKFRLFWSPVEIGNNQSISFFARLSPISAIYWIGFPVLACPAVAGIALVGRRWRTWALPVLFLLLYMGSVVLFFCPARYRLPIVPVLALLAAQGAIRLVEALRTRRAKPVLAYVAVMGLIVAFLFTNPPERAMFERKSDGLAHVNLGVLYGLRAREDPQQFEPAIQHLQKALELRPDDVTARIALGSCYALARRMAEAGEQFRLAVAHQPEYADSHLYLARYLEVTGQPEEAGQHYRQAVQLAPARPDIRCELANILIKRGSIAEAEEQYRTAAWLAPDYPEALTGLAWIHERNGQIPEARRLLQRALEAARSAGNAQLAQQIEARLRQYEQRP